MPRLRAYVRRTMLKAARNYAYPAKRRTAESTRDACMDYTRGTDTGIWHDLIYTVDVLELFNRYRSDVAATIRDFMEETGATMCQSPIRSGPTYAEMLAATARRYDDKVRDPRGLIDDAAQLAIRFAVEYLAGEVARDLCPDL